MDQCEHCSDILSNWIQDEIGSRNECEAAVGRLAHRNGITINSWLFFRVLTSHSTFVVVLVHFASSFACVKNVGSDSLSHAARFVLDRCAVTVKERKWWYQLAMMPSNSALVFLVCARNATCRFVRLLLNVIRLFRT